MNEQGLVSNCFVSFLNLLHNSESFWWALTWHYCAMFATIPTEIVFCHQCVRTRKYVDILRCFNNRWSYRLPQTPRYIDSTICSYMLGDHSIQRDGRTLTSTAVAPVSIGHWTAWGKQRKRLDPAPNIKTTLLFLYHMSTFLRYPMRFLIWLEPPKRKFFRKFFLLKHAFIRCRAHFSATFQQS